MIKRIVLEEGETRIEFSGGKVEEMKYNERQDDQAAYDHVS